MKVLTVDLTRDYNQAIEEAVLILQQGGVIVYPTDTLYGLGCNALNELAVKKVFEIKKHSLAKPLRIVARDMRWVEELAHVTPQNRDILSKIWPGKFTVVLPQKDIIPDIVTAGTKTVGIRVPDFRFLNDLLVKFGYPLVSTTVNITNEEPRQKPDEIREIFENADVQPDLMLDVGTLPPSSPSTLVDLTTHLPKILRVGATTPEQLLKLLQLQ